VVPSHLPTTAGAHLPPAGEDEGLSDPS